MGWLTKYATLTLFLNLSSASDEGRAISRETSCNNPIFPCMFRGLPLVLSGGYNQNRRDAQQGRDSARTDCSLHRVCRQEDDIFRLQYWIGGLAEFDLFKVDAYYLSGKPGCTN